MGREEGDEEGEEEGGGREVEGRGNRKLTRQAATQRHGIL